MKYWSRVAIGVAVLVGGLVPPMFGVVHAQNAEPDRPTVPIDADRVLLDFFDVACADVKNFESLKTAVAQKKWSPIPLKSVPHLNRVVALFSFRRSEIQKVDAYEYSTDVGGKNIFIHIERVEYNDGKYANRCSIHDFLSNEFLSSAQLRKWQGRDPDRFLDRGAAARSAEWLQLPSGAPRVTYYYRKSQGKTSVSPVPDGTHLQIEFSGLRQKA
jgi:hypothetical protein